MEDPSDLDPPLRRRNFRGITLYTLYDGKTEAGDGTELGAEAVASWLADEMADEDAAWRSVDMAALVPHFTPANEFVAWLRWLADAIERGELPGPGDAPTLLRGSDVE